MIICLSTFIYNHTLYYKLETKFKNINWLIKHIEMKPVDENHLSFGIYSIHCYILRQSLVVY
jgi:hypothetical protein